MKRTVRAVVLAVAVMAMMVPAVSADGDWGVVREREFTCDPGNMTLLVILPPSEFTTPAIVPFHVVGSGSVLVPFVFTFNGTTYMSKPLADRHADRLVHCQYVDEKYGAHIEITGFLTPAR